MGSGVGWAVGNYFMAIHPALSARMSSRIRLLRRSAASSSWARAGGGSTTTRFTPLSRTGSQCVCPTRPARRTGRGCSGGVSG